MNSSFFSLFLKLLLALTLMSCEGLLPEDDDSDDDNNTDTSTLESTKIDDQNHMHPFQLRFASIHDSQQVGCDDTIEGLGQNGDQKVGIGDLRFYISNLQFLDEDGNEIMMKLEENHFQLKHEAGSVALIDLSHTQSGACESSAIGAAEGTSRVNQKVVGKTHALSVHEVRFDVGVSQPVMQAVINNHTAEDAPSPLREMYWSWASGYRHFVMNFTLENDNEETGEGYIHLGSRDCGEGAKALSDQEFCGLLNTATVTLSNFDLEGNIVAVDVKQLLDGLSFVTDVKDSETNEVIGQKPGVACHSARTQEDCETIFTNMGLDLESGKADASNNNVFVKESTHLFKAFEGKHSDDDSDDDASGHQQHGG